MKLTATKDFRLGVAATGYVHARRALQTARAANFKVQDFKRLEQEMFDQLSLAVDELEASR